jgi:hypothetical protein
MHILLFVFYSLLCGYCLVKIPIVRKSGIRPVLLLGLFALHVLTGCLHNVIAWRYYPEHGDIWRLFAFSLSDRQLLATHQFSQLLADNSGWTYFSHNGVTFVLMVLNLFSFDNLYIDTLLFSFPVFLGNIALYRMFRRRFPADPLTAVTVFLLPSTLFWTSCIHRDGVLYMSLGFLFYLLDRIFTPAEPTPGPAAPPLRRRSPRRRYLYACCCFLLIIYFRTVVAALLVPAILAWSLTERPLPRRRALLLAGACVGILAILLSVPPLSAWPVNMLSHFQSEFRDLEGHSRLYLPALDGSWNSVWRVFPSALLNGLLEPLPGSGGQRIYLAFSVELFLIWGIVLAAATHRLFSRPGRPPFPVRPDHRAGPSSIANSYEAFAHGWRFWYRSHPRAPSHSRVLSLAFSRCCLLFSLSGMLLIGAIVPFAGAIVRYRSLYLPFLLAPFLHSLTRWPPLRRLNQRLAAWLPDPDRGSIS